jgi:hypothetical protein
LSLYSQLANLCKYFLFRSKPLKFSEISIELLRELRGERRKGKEGKRMDRGSEEDHDSSFVLQGVGMQA